jgi:uracil-DNA glycosylase
MNVRIEPTWKKVLQKEFEKPYFKTLTEFVKKEYQDGKVYPPPKYIFNAFDQTPFNQVKVVILGQDPYHGAGQANGLSFAVAGDQRLPPSLQNIYKELHTDLGVPPKSHGDLVDWAEQGVLLLNATLTVRASSPGSHQNKGWEEFTDAVIRILSEQKENLVFILWGAYAQKKGGVINTTKGHLIIRSPHPSPFSAHSGFFGSRPFSQTNTFLMLSGKNPIVW